MFQSIGHMPTRAIRQSRIGMQEQQGIAAGVGGARIHLACPAALGMHHSESCQLGQPRGAVRTAAVGKNNFATGALVWQQVRE